LASSRITPDGKWDVSGRRRRWLGQWLTAPRLLGGSFALLIAIGTFGLKWLPGLYVDESLGWIDACFTATSAVCVTGLIVEDTATYFTTAGQAWILLLIQLGGLGMIAFSSLIIIAMGRRLSLRHEAVSSDYRLAAPAIDMSRLAFDVMRFTAIFEVAGAVLLYGLWAPRLGIVGAAWPALFHSVSAFCNAGFSTFTDNLIGYRDAPLTLLVIGLLIVFGGLGFLTLEELKLRHDAGRMEKAFRLSLHSRIVLFTTAALLAAGWVLFCLFEWDRTFAGLPVVDRLSNGLFMSATARTAGFNAIDYGKASDSANLLTIILMSIGGSPGSTAGGIKTTTFALIGLLAWSRLRGFETTMFASRSVREETTERAIGLFVIAIAVTICGVFFLTAAESGNGASGRFLPHLLEVSSAFNTVGLSMGQTPGLTSTGRVLLTALMFLGRIGPLTLGAAIALRQTGVKRFRYAYEEVVVG
jgi:trk system potassium uptake protein TrkH